MEDLIEAHLDWCRVAGHVPDSVDNRSILLRAAHRKMDNGLLADERELAKYLGNQKWSIKYRHCNFSALNAFYEWAVAHDQLDWNPLTRLKAPKVPASDPRPWTDRQLAELLRRARQPYRLAVVLANYAGLRCCEIVRLDEACRSLVTIRPHGGPPIEQEYLRVVGKGGKVAEVEMHPRVTEELAHFPGTAPYIVQAGGRADRHWLSVTAAAYFREVLGIRVTLHQGRHWYTTGVLEQTDNLVAAQHAARHSTISSTVGYAALRNGQRRLGILALPVLDEAAS